MMIVNIHVESEAGQDPAWVCMIFVHLKKISAQNKACKSCNWILSCIFQMLLPILPVHFLQISFYCKYFAQNAPHIPVHLGGMQAAVRFQLDHIGARNFHPGDVLLCNMPRAGGSHLPDLTVITPVFLQQQHEVLGGLGGIFLRVMCMILARKSCRILQS